MQTFDRLLIQGIKQAVEKYKQIAPEGLLSDLYIQWLPEEALLKFYDDDEHFLSELSTDTLDELISDESISSTLDQLLKTEELVALLNSDFTLRPFSMMLVDEEMKNISEHFLLDSDAMVLDRGFMEHLDKELNDFMDKLFGDSQ
ncbi:MAG: hypothetical protein ACRC9Q_00395 [Bacteroidales bacterium]